MGDCVGSYCLSGILCSKLLVISEHFSQRFTAWSKLALVYGFFDLVVSFSISVEVHYLMSRILKKFNQANLF